MVASTADMPRATSHSAIYQGETAVKGAVSKNLSEFINVVDASNTVKRSGPGRFWRFIKDTGGVEHVVVGNVSREDIEKEDVSAQKENPELPSGSNMFTCDVCKSSFPSQEKLKEHGIQEKSSYVKSRPHMERPSDCVGYQPDHTHYQLPPRTSRKRASPSSFTCPMCSKYYKTQKGFREHMKRLHNAKRSCQVAKDSEVQSSSISGVPGFTVLFTEEGQTYHSRVESPKMTYSTSRVFKDLQVKKEIDLINFERSGQHDMHQLQLLEGACCDPLPVSPSNLPLSPTPSPTTSIPSSSVYLETHSKFQTLTAWAGIALGVCEEGALDSHRVLSKQERTWCVCVGNCSTHKNSLCTKVWEGPGKQAGECSIDTLLPKSPQKGSKAVVKLAMVVHVQNGRIGFIDLDREKVLYKFDCEFKDALCPVFSISTTPEVSRRTMTLVTGSDVVFTDKKKSLICEALSDF